MWLRYLTGPLGLLIAGTFLGAPLGMSISPWLMGRMDAAWIGFAGSVAGGIAGGAMTIIAGFIAWGAAMRQIEATRQRDRRDDDALYSMAVVYCYGVEKACNSIEEIGACFLSRRRYGEQLDRKDALARFADIRRVVDDDLGLVRDDDLEVIIHRLPVIYWRPLRELINIKPEIDFVRARIIEEVNGVSDLLPVPIPKARALVARMDVVRGKAIELKVELETARGKI